MDNRKQYKWHAITAAGILILLFMHLYKLTQVPYGLNVDEASGAYDALNIARYGVDRHLNSYPVYFTNYADGQNALYIYATAFLVKIFGMSKSVIRTVPTVAALLAAVFGWLYMKNHMPTRKGDVIWLVLYAILPVFTMTQRFGLESHLLLPMSMISIYFVAKAMDSDKWRYYLAGGVSLGITLYTYALTYIVIPVFGLLLLGYAVLIRRLRVKKVCAMIGVLVVFGIPLALVQMINLFDLPQMQIGPFTFTKVLDYRLDEVAGASVLQNIRSIFVNTFLYDDLTYNTSFRYGTMYYFSIPFLLAGVVRCVAETVISVKEKVFSYSVPMLLWFVSEWIMGAFLSGHSVPNSTRMIGVFIPMLYFLVKGLYWVVDAVKRNTLQKAVIGIISICYTVTFLNFATYYFTDFNEEAFPMKWLFYETYDGMDTFLEEHKEESWCERPISYPWNYIYYALEFEINPYELNLPVNGREKFGKDYINEYPEEIVLESNYVVYKTDSTSKEYLSLLGYEALTINDSFVFYVSPFDGYFMIDGDDARATIEKWKVDTNGILLSGWCADSKRNTYFDAITVTTQGGSYKAEILQRQDVADYLGDPEGASYGFQVLLPKDLFQKTDYIMLNGHRLDGTSERIRSFERK